MNKKLTLLLPLCLMVCMAAQAQKGDATYDQKAADIQKKVWGDKLEEFEIKTIPAAMEKESAVIIAQYTNVEQSSNSRLKFAFYIPTSATRTNKVTTFRERVKINDKAALDEYSSLEYQKSLDNTQGFLYLRYQNKKDTYIGAKIIKPNGQEVIVNTSEEILTKNETKDKQGKLAIPGLEVGDILDYYVSKVELLEASDATAGVSHYLFVLSGEHPILNYVLNLQYNSKMNVYYINANKAPEFKENLGDNGDKIYNLKLKDLPKYSDKLWSSPLREYPYIEFSANFSNRYLNFLINNTDKYNNNISRLANVVKSYEKFFGDKTYLYTDYKNYVKGYYKSGKALKTAPLDSSMRVMYDWWKFHAFCTYKSTGEMDFTTNRNKMHAISQVAVYEMARSLIDMDVDFDILLLAPRNSSSLENVFEKNDLRCLIRINGEKPMYMSFYDMFTQFNELPENYQGETAVVLSPRKHSLDKFEEGTATLPIAPSNQNYINAQMNVMLLPGNMQKVKIERTLSEAGIMKNEDQAGLVLPEDYDKTFTALLGGMDIAKRVGNKKIATEYDNAFEKAREDIPANFKSEIGNEFGQEPQNLSNYKINNIGISSVNPVFSYTGTFEMDNFVKRAGNNYIFEAGKLIGAYGKIDEKQRDRKIDIYMPAARTLSYDLNIAIPKGYQVKGAEDLNQHLKNETGELSIVAKIEGDKLSIKVTRIYAHNFEKVAQWPKLLELLDGAYNFSTQKVLFEKI